MFKLFALIIGFGLLMIQSTISVNTMNVLSEPLPSYIGYSMIALVILFEASKPLLTIALQNDERPGMKLFSGVLLICLSIGSIYSVHYTMNLSVSNTYTEAEKMTLKSLDEEKKAYLKAAEKGVISATSPLIEKISQERNSILNKDEKKVSQKVNSIWAIAISIITEFMIIACFSIFSFARQSQKVFAATTTRTETIEHVEQIEICENKPDGVREIQRFFNVGYDKAKKIQKVYGLLPQENNTIEIQQN